MRFDVGSLSEFAQGSPRQLVVGERRLVAVRIDDEVFVLDDRCSHEAFWLSDGFVDVKSREIECARHGAMFRLSDGSPQSLPATKPVERFDVDIENGRVVVEIP